ncbi:MAG: hypothetical protein WC827_03185 [Candidatus Paceibacterota bacterium]|jgi:hypothetical protein
MKNKIANAIIAILLSFLLIGEPYISIGLIMYGLYMGNEAMRDKYNLSKKYRRIIITISIIIYPIIFLLFYKYII